MNKKKHDLYQTKAWKNNIDIDVGIPYRQTEIYT